MSRGRGKGKPGTGITFEMLKKKKKPYPMRDCHSRYTKNPELSNKKNPTILIF
jgi:hypothetical protein